MNSICGVLWNLCHGYCKDIMDLLYVIVRTSPVYLWWFWSPLQGDCIPRLYLWSLWWGCCSTIWCLWWELSHISCSHSLYIVLASCFSFEHIFLYTLLPYKFKGELPLKTLLCLNEIPFVCKSLCCHQISKRGRLKGQNPLILFWWLITTLGSF